MKTSSAAVAAGVVLGLALFVAAGLIVLTGEGPGPDRMQPGPIDANVVAPAEQLGQALAMVAAHTKPCVVSVYSEKTVNLTEPDSNPFGDDFLRRFFGGQAPRQQEYKGIERGMGSGMILDKDGHVLTNYHVVKGMSALKIQLPDKRTFEAVVVGTDPKTDVAVIRIKGKVPSDLPSITLGDSDKLQVGNLVLAIGAPFGLAQTVTQGIISATGRSNVGIAGYEDFLQTDAPINPGNSGGPLVNMRGEVIGMNSAIATSVGQFAGVGFSIPSNMIKSMLPRLLKGEKIVRGQLGVVIQPMSEALAKQFGLPESKGILIAQVEKNSPAAEAGLKAGDVIVRYDGREVNEVHQLRDLVAGTAPGTKVKLEIMREGKPQTLAATVGKQSAEASVVPLRPAGTTLEKFGLSVETLTPDLAKQLGVQEDEKGVAIADVASGSVAAMAGLQKGDVIVEADRQKVESVSELGKVLENAKDKQALLLLIQRQGQSMFVVLQLQ